MNIFKYCKLADKDEIIERLVEQALFVFFGILALLGFAGMVLSLFSLIACGAFVLDNEPMEHPFEIFLLWWGSIVWPGLALFGLFLWAKATFCRG